MFIPVRMLLTILLHAELRWVPSESTMRPFAVRGRGGPSGTASTRARMSANDSSWYVDLETASCAGRIRAHAPVTRQGRRSGARSSVAGGAKAVDPAPGQV
eukprot:c7847_g1_i1.p4 GENE.c7847_g1_i1~~c7847_g1_i1.p4  ORF type:complete len:101 (+),score=1.35 c7847_g1_i1:1076-1378(+)